MANILKVITDRAIAVSANAAASAHNIKNITPLECEVTIINRMGCPITIHCQEEKRDHGKKVVGDGENYRMFINRYSNDTYVWGEVWWKGWAHCREDHPLRFDVFGRSAPQHVKNHIYIKPKGIIHEKKLVLEKW